MDIKSKKCKVIAAWAAFFLSICLLVESGVAALNVLSGNGPRGVGVKDAFSSDYEDTKEFRRFVSDYLDTFLSMATGGPVNWYGRYGDVAYSDDTTWNIGDIENTATAVVEEIAEQGWDYSGDYSEDDWEYTVSPKKVHASIKNDKNLLYDIRYDGKSVYTNDDEAFLKNGEKDLPSDYNFYLSFADGKASVVKDKKAVDVYGDDLYREDSKWQIPGYKNYTVDDKTKKAEVRMAVRKTPVNYVQGNYSSDSGSYYGTSSLYDTVRNLNQAKNAYVAQIVKFIVGLILLGIYLALRKYKKDGDRAIAVCTGKIWMECKAGLVILVIAGGIAGLNNYIDIYYGWGYYEYAAEVLYPMMYSLFANPILVLVFFWTLYLFVNDYRYNKKKPGKTLVKDIQKLLQTRNMEYPFQKKMIRKFSPVMISGIILSVIAALACFVTGYYLYDDGGSFGVVLLLVALVVLVIVLLVGMMKQYASDNQVFAGEIGRLVDQITKVHDGNMTDKLKVPEDSDLYEAVQQLNDIQSGMDTALSERMKSERMKVELVSNVSHDIKTPLTSIISYVDLMKQEENLPEEVKDYIRILDIKSQRLKSMVQDVFEISKAASKQLPVDLEDLDLGKLLRQTLADMEEQIEESSVTVKAQIPADAVMIHADGSRLYRVFQNLLQNALKYSLNGSRVFITLKTDSKSAKTTVKNISQDEIPSEIDFTERFVRGDESRTDGGSGLGLSIARSFTEACGGVFGIEVDADLFVVTVEFPILQD